MARSPLYDPYDVYGGEEDMYGVNQLRQQNLFSNFSGNFTNQDQGLDINAPPYDPQSAYDPISGNYGDPQQYTSPWTQPAYTQPTPPSQPMPTTKAPSQDDQFNRGFNRIKQIADTFYTPSNAASSKFNEMIDAFPQYERPGIGRRIAAGLATLAPTGEGGRAGMAGANQILYGPYNQEVVRWKERIAPAQEAARQENAQNVNERTLATQMAAQIDRQERDIELNRSNVAKEEDARNRTAILEYKKLHPNVSIYDNGQEMIMLDPATQKPIPTGIPGRLFSEMQKILLRNKGDVDVANIHAESAENVAGIAADSRENVARMRIQSAERLSELHDRYTRDYIELRHQNSIELKTTPGPVAQTQKEFNAQLSGKLGQLYNTDAEARKHIVKNPDGTYGFAPPPHSIIYSAAANEALAAAHEKFAQGVYDSMRQETVSSSRTGGPTSQSLQPSAGGTSGITTPAPTPTPAPSGARGPAYPTPGSPGIRRNPDGSLSGISFFEPKPSPQQAVVPQQTAPPRAGAPQAVQNPAAPQVPMEAAPPPPQAAVPQVPYAPSMFTPGAWNQPPPGLQKIWPWLKGGYDKFIGPNVSPGSYNQDPTFIGPDTGSTSSTPELRGKDYLSPKNLYDQAGAYFRGQATEAQQAFLEEKAKVWLTNNGMEPNPANIKHAIEVGDVR